jgi:predicted transcriptional regulator YdeE
MPDCVADKWKELWGADMSRAYKADFEIYDEKSRDWKNAEVDIFISVK